MRTVTTLAALLLASALAACSGDAPNSLPSEPVAAVTRAKGALASRPITGHCVLTLLATDPYPAPPVVRQTAEGTCELAHLGLATVHFVQVVNFATGTQHSLELTYTAANGDVLRAASAGTSAFTAAGVSFSATITFQGGTGRFANATGQARVEGTADLATGTSQYDLDGWIAYDASGRSGT